MVSTLPREYLQVMRGGGRGGVSVSGACGAVFGRAPPHPLVSTTDFTAVSFGVPTKETMQVYSHLGTHATPAVKSSKIKNSYCDLRVFGAFLRCMLPRIAV